MRHLIVNANQILQPVEGWGQRLHIMYRNKLFPAHFRCRLPSFFFFCFLSVTELDTNVSTRLRWASVTHWSGNESLAKKTAHAQKIVHEKNDQFGWKPIRETRRQQSYDFPGPAAAFFFYFLEWGRTRGSEFIELAKFDEKVRFGFRHVLRFR